MLLEINQAEIPLKMTFLEISKSVSIVHFMNEETKLYMILMFVNVSDA